MTFADIERILLVAVLVWSALATVLAIFAIVIGRRQVGRPVHVVKGSVRSRIVVAGLIVAACLLVLAQDGPPVALVLPTLAMGLFITIAAPRREDSVFGTDGARRGWHARRWEQLEGWRLSGNHLRFLVHGELAAVEVPEPHVADLRARLETICPDAESTFKE